MLLNPVWLVVSTTGGACGAVLSAMALCAVAHPVLSGQAELVVNAAGGTGGGDNVACVILRVVVVTVLLHPAWLASSAAGGTYKTVSSAMTMHDVLVTVLVSDSL